MQWLMNVWLISNDHLMTVWWLSDDGLISNCLMTPSTWLIQILVIADFCFRSIVSVIWPTYPTFSKFKGKGEKMQRSPKDVDGKVIWRIIFLKQIHCYQIVWLGHDAVLIKTDYNKLMQAVLCNANLHHTYILECPALWRITMNSLHNEGMYKWVI